MRSLLVVCMVVCMVLTASVSLNYAQAEDKAPAASAPAAAATQPSHKMDTPASRYSYGMGLEIGRSIRTQPIAMDAEAIIEGIRDAIRGSKPKLSDEQIQAAMEEVTNAFHAEMKAKRQDPSGMGNKEEGSKNASTAVDFLEKNMKNPGVIATSTGLQYKVLQEGKGKKPSATDTVVVHYRGTLMDGTEFDSSYKRGEPAEFQVNRVIAGWTEALQMMTEGSKWELYIPPTLGYGSKGAGKLIGPNAMLIFQVELIKVK